ncbi:IclR family transcriptional regulator [Burkholderiaceae bacterium FT117]|uniref:IclR family transcriptional regulator n=1 Tax=Zeimonas sediminis TaxID=2944268 RepID=UPI00234303E6|nr:IclR family transcriptional regulator [Zeimonas sediminis]MCM5570335.1 IclR family transcriptional regulator [Zeimonas sediminis]
MSRSPRGSARPAPTSSVQRACRILQVLSDTRNGRLTDIAAAAGQDKATVLRLLDVLAGEGFVVRDPASKRYSLGAEVFVLGAAAAARFDPRPIARPSLIRLANAFQDSTILSIARGAESVCVDVELGSFPIRATYLEVGSRRPLGAGAGSLALLAWMPDPEIEALMPSILAGLGRYPRITQKALERHVAQSRKRGYAVMLDLVVDKMGGIAMPILGGDGRPVAAISIAALTERIVSREAALAEALRREVAACEAIGALGAAARSTGATRHRADSA